MSVTAVPLRPIKKGSVLKLWLGLAALAIAAATVAWIGTEGQQVTVTESGLRIQVVEEGEGPEIGPDDLIALHYEGRIEDGTVFDASRPRGQPMITGLSGVIPGFAEGLRRMRQGGVYRLWIPPELAYRGNVPPGAPFDADDTLIFDIEILEVAQGMAAMQPMMGPPQAGPDSPSGR